MKKVDMAWRSRRPLTDVRAWVDGSLSDTLRRAGYRLDSRTETGTGHGVRTEWVLHKTERSPLLFPISLLAFLANSSTYRVVMALAPLADGRTELLIAGDLPRSIAKLLGSLASPQA